MHRLFKGRDGVERVDEPDVNVIGAHALERSVQGVEQGAAGRIDHATLGSASNTGLGAQLHLVPLERVRKQRANHSFCLAVRVSGRGINQGATCVEKVLKEKGSFIGRCVARPRHCAEGETRHLRSARAQSPHLHARETTCRVLVSGGGARKVALCVMTWWEAVVLGLVQGLTEFLPISSSAHVRVLGPLLPHGDDPGAAFTAIIQLGTEAAVLVYFWKDIVRIVSAWLRALAGKDGRDRRARLGAHNADARLGWWVILGSVPIVAVGLTFQEAIESSLRHLYITAVVLAVFGLVLGWADRTRPATRELSELTLKDAVLLGLAQAAAVVPGVSRSGGTITAGRLLGLTRTAAARYSFLLAIPAVIGSAVFEIVTNSGEITEAGGPGIAATVIATVVAFVVGYAVIVWFLRLVTTRSFMPFVVYRIGFAALIVVLVATGTVAATGA